MNNYNLMVTGQSKEKEKEEMKRWKRCLHYSSKKE